LNSILVKSNTELKQYLASKLLLDLPPLPLVRTEENFIKNEKDFKNINSLISKSNDLMRVNIDCYLLRDLDLNLFLFIS